jgi:ABC-type dipeptide/oligopeptide/nickel transport system ATPase component
LSDAPLEFRVSAGYAGRTVLHDVSGTIARGEIAALVGLSGSGKSTLALALLRLLHYRGGEVTGSIRLDGRELMGLREHEMRPIRGQGIGYVPQSPAAALNPRLAVSTLLNETWRAHSREHPGRDFFTQLLESVHLPGGREFLAKKAGQLSTGQGQRLLIALAIMHNPAVLIADEPTSALDVITQARVLKLFEDLNRARGAAILFISHDLLSVGAISHRVDILNEGRIVESGSPGEIFQRPVHAFTKELVAAMPRPPAL